MYITLKMRTFSIFKIKNFKNWKINEKVLNYIFYFDKIINEDIYKFEFNTETKSLYNI